MQFKMLGIGGAPLCRQPLFLPHFPPRLFFASPVSAKRRRNRSGDLREEDWQDDYDEDLGFPGLPSLHSDHTDPNQTEASIGGGALRGSDVLLAMQRAAAAAANSSRKKGNRERPRRSGARGKNKQTAANFKDVRPIEIRNEWETKISELAEHILELRARHQ